MTIEVMHLAVVYLSFFRSAKDYHSFFYYSLWTEIIKPIQQIKQICWGRYLVNLNKGGLNKKMDEGDQKE